MVWRKGGCPHHAQSVNVFCYQQYIYLNTRSAREIQALIKQAFLVLIAFMLIDHFLWSGSWL